jgi:hypothetical protein
MNSFVKDGNLYRIKSKHITHKYNISPMDKAYIDEKLSYQNQFLKNHHILINDNNFISLFDMSMGANIRPDKYLAELSNRVASFKKFADENRFFAPVFLTMTPESHFKPCRTIKVPKHEKMYIIDDNKKFTGDYDNYVKDCRDNIQQKFRKFLNDQIFKDIKKKYGHRAPYFSSYEPSLDGALHKHSLFFLPPEFVERFVKRFRHYFGFAIEKTEVFNSETNAYDVVEKKIPLIHDVKTVFDDDAGGVAAYIMKYVLKSFRNAETHELTDEGYWYAKHGLMRFTSARVLLPLYIWRSIRSPELSYLEMSKKYHDNTLQITIVAKHHKYHLEDFKRSNYNLAQVDYHQYDENNVYIGFDTLYTRSRDRYDFYSTDVRYSPAPKAVHHENVCSLFPMSYFMDGQSFVFDGFNSHALKSSVSSRSSMDLYKYFQSLNPDTCNLHHYHYVRNELIKRRVIDGIPVASSAVCDLLSVGREVNFCTLEEMRTYSLYF